MIAKSFLGPWDMRNADKIAEFLVEHSESMCYYAEHATVNQFEFINEDEL